MMRASYFLRAVLLALALMADAACAQQPEPALASRAVWTWEGPSYAMLESPQAMDEALAFLQRKRINIVYLYADAYEGRNLIEQRPQLYRAFIRRAHERGIQTYALLGSWYLSTERYVLPRHHRKARAMLQRV